MLIQKQLTPTQKKRKFLLGDIFLGLDNGNFGDYLPGWKDHGSISAIDVSSGQAGVEVRHARAGARRGQPTASGLGFAGGGDGVLRAFDSKTRQGAVDVPDRPPDRRRPDDLLGRRQGVRGDHGRRHADLVRRRPRLAAPGVLDRRQQGRVAEAAGPGLAAGNDDEEPPRSPGSRGRSRAATPDGLRGRHGSRFQQAPRRWRSGTRTAPTSFPSQARCCSAASRSAAPP